jgi:SAM-dependent methyltransferase
VFAIETAPPMLAGLRENCQDRQNIHPVEAPNHDTRLAAGCCDRVLVANLWAELTDPVATLREAARLLREDGRLIIIEWQAEAASPLAPRPNARIGFDEMLQLLERNTWDVHRHGNFGPDNYFLEAGVSDESVQS